MSGEGAPVPLPLLVPHREASTRLWERFPEAMKPAMERHDAILREAVEHFDGRVVKTTGDGMMAAPSSPPGSWPPPTEARCCFPRLPPSLPQDGCQPA